MKKFEKDRLKDGMGKVADWMRGHKFPPRMLLIIMGIMSTIWFLVRVIPKPSRASYPCMQVVAPIMSGFIVYLLSLGGAALAFRKVRQNIIKRRYLATGLFLFIAAAGLIFTFTHNSQNASAADLAGRGPDDGANQPFGKATGVNPGRVVWSWNPDATNKNCLNTFESKDWTFKPANTDRGVVRTMFREAVEKLTGGKSIPEAWDILFRYQNLKKYNKSKSYAKGEKILLRLTRVHHVGCLLRKIRITGIITPRHSNLLHSVTQKITEARKQVLMLSLSC